MFVCSSVFLCQGPYGNFGKVDDFKVVGAKLEEKGKRTYRQGRLAAVATAAMAAARADLCSAGVFFISSVGSWIASQGSGFSVTNVSCTAI